MHVPLDDRVKRWLDQATADLEIAVQLRDRYAHQACFHAQQSAEKALKAYLTRLTGDVIPTHELDRLVSACDRVGAIVPDDVRSDARSLDKFYISTRYPDALGFADAALTYQLRDAETAIASATRVREWCNEGLAEVRASDADPP